MGEQAHEWMGEWMGWGGGREVLGGGRTKREKGGVMASR